MKKRSGFTLVEIMIVVAIIGLLAAMAIPAFQRARLESQTTRVANDLRILSDAFVLYALDEGSFPDDEHIVLPAGMEPYIKQKFWDAPVWGGHFNYEGPDFYPYTGIAITDSDAPASVMLALDEKCDDADLSTGKFRQTPNGRYTYIIEE